MLRNIPGVQIPSIRITWLVGWPCKAFGDEPQSSVALMRVDDDDEGSEE